MSIDVDAIGPVDIAVIGFEGNNFHGDIAPAIVELAQAGIIRVIDLSFVAKDADGNVVCVEVMDSEVAHLFGDLVDDQHDLLSDEDLEAVGADLEPSSAAMLVVWENTWASKFAQAVRGANGHLVSFDRVPHEIVAAAVEALQEA